MSQAEALKFPPHYPPRTFWKKFFIGVRRLGPDLSFFPKLEMLQRSRSEAVLQEWGDDPQRLAVAQMFSEVLRDELRWPNAFFIPRDEFGVIAAGPKFEEVDDLGFDVAIQSVENAFKLNVPFQFWRDCLERSYGEVVDAIVIRSQGT